MTAPTAPTPLAPQAQSIRERLTNAARAGLRGDRKPTKAGDRSPRQAKIALEQLRDLGIQAVGFHSSDAELGEWEDRLWHDQDDPLEDLQKEWRLHLHYIANQQFLAFHKARREWVLRKAVPWRIRSAYNICGKAVETRTTRLVENKPTVSVQSATVDADDVERAEYKETLFWGLWEKLSLHWHVTEVRTWASIAGTGFSKVGWDPDAGLECPVTIKRPQYLTIQMQQLDPATNAPTGATIPKQVYAGLEEIYLDKNGQELGPTEQLIDDPDNPGHKKRVRVPVPDEADTYCEGEAYVLERSGFNLRWDRYVEDPCESWYVQDAEIMPGTKVVAQFPEALDKLQAARFADDEEKASFWKGLQERDPSAPARAMRAHTSATGEGSELTGDLEREYLVRETWIYPKNPFLRKLWGKKGYHLVTVGGQVVKRDELPEWACWLTQRGYSNFVRWIDLPEKGNHYGKPVLRDVIPMQDDLNRTRSMRAERLAMISRLILTAPQNHAINMRLLGAMPGVLMTAKTRDHLPTPLQLNNGGEAELEAFYQSSLQAAQDVGSMNDASTGKLPSAGIAAKAIYALQYADEKSISKTSTLQDVSLKRLAMALDAVTRFEYKESRKIRISGEDRAFQVETEILPDHLDVEVDYFFTPGSMVSRQKDAVRNEMISWMEAGLIDAYTVRKFAPTAVPDVFRRSNDLQEAKARRVLQSIVKDGETQVQPDPWDDPNVFIGVLEEFMLTRKFELLGDEQKQTLAQLWQALKEQIAAAEQAAQAAAAQQNGGAPPTPQGGQKPPAKGKGAPPGGAGGSGGKAPSRAQPVPPFDNAQGAAALEQEATAAMGGGAG